MQPINPCIQDGNYLAGVARRMTPQRIGLDRRDIPLLLEIGIIGQERGLKPCRRGTDGIGQQRMT